MEATRVYLRDVFQTILEGFFRRHKLVVALFTD